MIDWTMITGFDWSEGVSMAESEQVFFQSAIADVGGLQT